MSGLRGLLRLFPNRGIKARNGRLLHPLHFRESFLNSPRVHLGESHARAMIPSSSLTAYGVPELRRLHTIPSQLQISQPESDDSSSSNGTEAALPTSVSAADAPSADEVAIDVAEKPAPSPKDALAPIVPGMPAVRRGAAVAAPIGITLSPQGLIKEMTERIRKSMFQEAIQIYREWLQCLDPITGQPNKPMVTPCNIALLAEGLKGAPVDILLKRVEEMRRLGLNPNTDTFYVLFNAAADSKDLGAFDRLFAIVQDLGIPVQAEWCIKAITGIGTDADAWKAMDYVRIMVANNLPPDDAVISRLVSSFSRLGQALKATDIVRWGQKKEAFPSILALGDLLQACADTDVSEGALLALELLYGRRKGRPLRAPSLDEGTLLALLGMAARTGDLSLSSKAWEVLLTSLQDNRPPSQASFLARLHAAVTAGDLSMAISTLQAMEASYPSETSSEVFSPFTSLRPFVLGCARGGGGTLDTAYFKLEGLIPTQQAVPLSAINCVILGCSNAWDIDRAYQTFEAIRSVFGLMPNVHSCNALIDGFGKMRKIMEVLKVYEYMIGAGVQPDQRTYNLLVKAHAVNRDTKSAMQITNEIVNLGLKLDKDIALKLRRRFIRECDDEGARETLGFKMKFQYVEGFTGDSRRALLFTLLGASGRAPFVGASARA